MNDFAVSANHIGALASKGGIEALKAVHMEVPFATSVVKTLATFVEGAEWLDSASSAGSKVLPIKAARDRAEALLSQIRAKAPIDGSELKRACHPRAASGCGRNVPTIRGRRGEARKAKAVMSWSPAQSFSAKSRRR